VGNLGEPIIFLIMMRKICSYSIIYFSIFLLLGDNFLFSQNIENHLIDSLKSKLLISSKRDRINIYLKLAFQNLSDNNLINAEKFCSNAINLSDEISYEYERSIAFKYLGKIKYLNKEYRNAINIMSEVIRVNSNLFNDYEKSELFYLLGNSYFQIYYFEQSLLYGFKAIEKNQDTNLLLYKTFSLLSSSYFQLEEFLIAIKYQKESLKVAYSIHDSTLICAQLNEIGLSFIELNKLDSAKKYFETTLIVSHKINDYHYSSAILDNLGEISYKQNDFDKALLLFENALVIRKKIKYFWGMGNTSTNIGKIYLKKNDYINAEKYLKYGERYLNKHNEEVYKNLGLKNNYKLQSKLFENKSSPENSLKYYKLYNELNNNLNDQDVRIRYAKTKAKYETIQLQEDVKKREKTITNKTYYLLLTIFLGCLFTTFLIIVICIKNRRLKNKEKLLTEKTIKYEQEIELKNKELLCSVNSIFTKNYIISKIAQKLSDNLSNFKHANYPLITYVINELKQTMDETGWKEFEIYFSQVHGTFYENLNKKFPNLSNNDKRLCALIKLEMSNKEIAALTMTKHESVHTSRSRLRKKLKLNKKSNITEYLNEL